MTHQSLVDDITETVDIAIERLKKYEPPEGYYLTFSGGKDSVVIYDLAVTADVKFELAEQRGRPKSRVSGGNAEETMRWWLYDEQTPCAEQCQLLW